MLSRFHAFQRFMSCLIHFYFGQVTNQPETIKIGIAPHFFSRMVFCQDVQGGMFQTVVAADAGDGVDV
jgi:hypothetical protein